MINANCPWPIKRHEVLLDADDPQTRASKQLGGYRAHGSETNDGDVTVDHLTPGPRIRE